MGLLLRLCQVAHMASAAVFPSADVSSQENVNPESHILCRA